MFPSHQHKTHKIQIKRRFQQIQPKPPPLTPTTAQVMPPLTQIVTPKPAPKLIAVAVKKIIPIQPKPSQQQIPKLTQIQPKADASPPQQQSPSKLVIKKVSHIAMNTRRHSTGNSSKIVPTKELLESLKQENIIYQDNEDKPWYCKTCGRNYKWRNSLKQHIKNVRIKSTTFVFHFINFRKISFSTGMRRSTKVSLRSQMWLQNSYTFQFETTLEFQILQARRLKARRR